MYTGDPCVWTWERLSQQKASDPGMGGEGGMEEGGGTSKNRLLCSEWAWGGFGQEVEELVRGQQGIHP